LAADLRPNARASQPPHGPLLVAENITYNMILPEALHDMDRSKSATFTFGVNCSHNDRSYSVRVARKPVEGS
jgi:hypothetical protein